VALPVHSADPGAAGASGPAEHDLAGAAGEGGPVENDLDGAVGEGGPFGQDQADAGDQGLAAGQDEANGAEVAGEGAPADGQDGGAIHAETDAGIASLESRLAEALRAAPQSMPNVTIEQSPGGVLISLADQVEFGMFAIGSAEPLPETIAVMEKIAALLKDLPGRVIIRGHTDGRPFRSGDYDNWRLSSARAHMAYHMLVRGGLDERRVERIEGHADRHLKLTADPDAAENRRIEVLVQEVSS
jgi:chemotaxis protein MotB